MKGTLREEGEGGDVHEAPEALEGKGKLTRDGTRGQGTLQQSRWPEEGPVLTDLKGHKEGRTNAFCVSGGNKTQSMKIQFLFRKAFSSTLDVSNAHP